MLEKLDIRESKKDDLAAIESLYPKAFPNEDLLPLVRDLLNDSGVGMSLVGTIDARVVGHAIYTKCGVVGKSIIVALLGPLVVMPKLQRKGIGKAIVNSGMRRLKVEEVTRVFVLGDPAYYGRLGFHPEHLVEPPYPLPAEYDGAWQSQDLSGTVTSITGRLSVPQQWLQPALWAP